MTWVRKDDAAPLHPKFLRLSDGAYRMWDHGLAFCNRATTDGVIAKDLVPTLNHHGRWSPSEVDAFVVELVSFRAPHTHGLWIDDGDCYRVHDYDHHQAEAMGDRVTRKREVDRERKRVERERKDSVRNPSGVTLGIHPDSARSRTGIQPVSLVPSRPVPSENTACSPEHTDDAPEPVRPSPAERMETELATSSADSKLMDSLAAAFDRSWHSVTGRRIGVRARYERDRTRDLLEWARSVDPVDPVAVVDRAARSAASDPSCSGAGSPWAWFCAKPGKYLEPILAAVAVSPACSVVAGIEERLRVAREHRRAVAGTEGVADAKAAEESILAELRRANANATARGAA